MLVSRSLGKAEMVINLEDLKAVHILHSKFPKTLPEFRKSYVGQHVCNNIAKGQDDEKECEKERGVIIYLEERFEEEDNRIKNRPSTNVIHYVLNDFTNGFNTKLNKGMNLEPSQMNVAKGTILSKCYTCRPTPLHYRKTTNNLVANLISQRVIAENGDRRSKRVISAQFVKKPNRVPLALRLVVD